MKKRLLWILPILILALVFLTVLFYHFRDRISARDSGMRESASSVNLQLSDLRAKQRDIEEKINLISEKSNSTSGKTSSCFILCTELSVLQQMMDDMEPYGWIGLVAVDRPTLENSSDNEIAALNNAINLGWEICLITDGVTLPEAIPEEYDLPEPIAFYCRETGQSVASEVTDSAVVIVYGGTSDYLYNTIEAHGGSGSSAADLFINLIDQGKCFAEVVGSSELDIYSPANFQAMLSYMKNLSAEGKVQICSASLAIENWAQDGEEYSLLQKTYSLQLEQLEKEREEILEQIRNIYELEP